ncbi:hypothetical protein TRIATDRAFT_302073, partial [Trichoderma atroviride IMI 206040]
MGERMTMQPMWSSSLSCLCFKYVFILLLAGRTGTGVGFGIIFLLEQLSLFYCHVQRYPYGYIYCNAISAISSHLRRSMTFRFV